MSEGQLGSPLNKAIIDEPNTFGGNKAWATYIMAHGAGAAMDSDFMTTVSHGLAAAGVRVIRFEFPYMQERRGNGGRRPPNRAPVLLQSWHEIMQATCQRYANEPIFVGGKSMGGRMATLWLAEQQLALQQADQYDDSHQPSLLSRCSGCICWGYPFHPAGKPDKLRTEHLANFLVPSLILQGSRDALGNAQEVPFYDLDSTIQLAWLDDGDHDLKPRVKSGFTYNQHLQTAIATAITFMQQATS